MLSKDEQRLLLNEWIRSKKPARSMLFPGYRFTADDIWREGKVFKDSKLYGALTNLENHGLIYKVGKYKGIKALKKDGTMFKILTKEKSRKYVRSINKIKRYHFYRLTVEGAAFAKLLDKSEKHLVSSLRAA